MHNVANIPLQYIINEEELDDPVVNTGGDRKRNIYRQYHRYRKLVRLYNRYYSEFH